MLLASWVPDSRATAHLVDDASINTDTNVYSFQSTRLGFPTSDRQIVVAVIGTHGGSNARKVNTLTVGGVSASFVVKSASANEDNHTVELWAAEVLNGVDGTVEVTWDAGMSNCAICVYRLIGAETSAHDTGSDNGSPATTTLDVPTGGTCIAVSFAGSSATTTWAGAKEDVETTLETTTSRYTGASQNLKSGEAGRTITATYSTTSANRAMCCASWGRSIRGRWRTPTDPRPSARKRRAGPAPPRT